MARPRANSIPANSQAANNLRTIRTVVPIKEANAFKSFCVLRNVEMIDVLCGMVLLFLKNPEQYFIEIKPHLAEYKRRRLNRLEEATAQIEPEASERNTTGTSDRVSDGQVNSIQPGLTIAKILASENLEALAQESQISLPRLQAIAAGSFPTGLEIVVLSYLVVDESKNTRKWKMEELLRIRNQQFPNWEELDKQKRNSEDPELPNDES